MADDTASRLLTRQDTLAATKALYEPIWKVLADLTWPEANVWSQPDPESGSRADVAYDDTAKRALTRFAAGLEHAMTPRGAYWHSLAPAEGVQDDRQRAILDRLARRLFQLRYRPQAGFAAANFKLLMSLGAFGCGGVYLEARAGGGPRYQDVHLAELFCDNDPANVVDVVHRKYQLNGRQLRRAFGNDLPPRLDAAAEKEPFKNFSLLHVVEPDDEGDARRRGLPFASTHVAIDEGATLRRGGFGTMPYLVPRYMQTAGNVYGISVARLALAETRMVNRMEYAQLNAVNRAAEPPLLAPDDDLPAPILRPNAVNPGYLDPITGRELLVPLRGGEAIQLGEAKLQDKRLAIDDAFLGAFFRALVENPSMTATHVLELADQQAAQLAPFFGWMVDEYFGPLVQRELDILARDGMLDEEAAGLAYELEFTSPLARSRNAGPAAGILRTLEVQAGLAADDPRARHLIDRAEALRFLAHANGVPAELLRSREDVEALAQRDEQAMQAMQAAEAAPGVAQAAKAMTEMQAANAA